MGNYRTICRAQPTRERAHRDRSRGSCQVQRDGPAGQAGRTSGCGPCEHPSLATSLSRGCAPASEKASEPLPGPPTCRADYSLTYTVKGFPAGSRPRFCFVQNPQRIEPLRLGIAMVHFAANSFSATFRTNSSISSRSSVLARSGGRKGGGGGGWWLSGRMRSWIWV